MIRLLCIVLVVISFVAWGDEEESYFLTTRNQALGNTFILGVNDNLSFLLSPAIISATHSGKFFILKLSTGVGANLGYLNETFRLYSYDLVSLWSSFNTNTLLRDLENDPYGVLLNTRPMVVLCGPVNIGYVGDGFGILFFNDSKTSLEINQVISLPEVSLKSFMELGMAFGVGTYFDMFKDYTLYVGGNVIYTKRYKVPLDGVSVFEVIGWYNSFSEGVYRYYVADSFFGNAGLIVDDNTRFRYGLNVRNVLGRVFNWSEIMFKGGKENVIQSSFLQTYIPTKFDIGIQYYINRIWILPLFIVSDFSIEINFDDLFNFSEYWFKKINIGAEISVLKFLRLRCGISEGYITGGFSLDFYYLTIDASYTSSEEGTLPGQRGVQNLVTSVEIKI